MKAHIVFLTLAVTLLGISISQIVALDEIEDCPLGSCTPHCAVKQETIKIIAEKGHPCVEAK